MHTAARARRTFQPASQQASKLPPVWLEAKVRVRLCISVRIYYFGAQRESLARARCAYPKLSSRIWLEERFVPRPPRDAETRGTCRYPSFAREI